MSRKKEDLIFEIANKEKEKKKKKTFVGRLELSPLIQLPHFFKIPNKHSYHLPRYSIKNHLFDDVSCWFFPVSYELQIDAQRVDCISKFANSVTSNVKMQLSISACMETMTNKTQDGARLLLMNIHISTYLIFMCLINIHI